MTNQVKNYGNSTLPPQIRSSIARSVNGLDIHYLEAGFENKNSPLIVLLHGFPELCFSWRKIMVPLSEFGYHVVAPDQRGFGATAGSDRSYTSDLSSYYQINLVRDLLGLVSLLGYTKVKSVIGHDSGAGVAGWSSLIRPDIYESVVMMSAPFTGPPSVPFNVTNNSEVTSSDEVDIAGELALLERPRKHYQHYYRTPEANSDIMGSKDGVSNFIRAYYHHKSADWKENQPFRLSSWAARDLAQMPTYYIMDLNMGMAETVDLQMPSDEEVAANTWLTEKELVVYTEEYGRTGFQGGLNSYRMGSAGIGAAESQLYAGKTIDQPSMFISGANDWGTYQNPGSFERMQETACTDMRAVHLVNGAGHWVQQEQAEETSRLLLDFLRGIS